MKVNFKRIIIYPEKDWMINLLTNLLQCKICMNIINDPYDCLCCNQTFCKQCIINYINSNKKCPFDSFFQNKENIYNKKDKYNIRKSSSNFHKLISSLHFYCKNYNLGCKAELSIEDIKEHEKYCHYWESKNSTEVSTERDILNSPFNLFKYIKEKNKNIYINDKKDSGISFRNQYNFSEENENEINKNKTNNNNHHNTHLNNNTHNNHLNNNNNNNDLNQLTEKVNLIYDISKNEKLSLKNTFSEQNINEYNSYRINNSLSQNIPSLILSYDSNKAIKLKKHKINKNNINSNNILMNLTLNRFNEQIIEMKNKLRTIDKLVRNNNLYSSFSDKNFYSMTKNNSNKYFLNSESFEKIPEKINKNNSNLKPKIKKDIHIKNKSENRLLKNNTSKYFHINKNISENEKKEKIKLDKEKIKEIFNKIMDKKIIDIQKYIDKNCEYLKEYFMGLSFDNINAFTEKIDEFQELLNSKN